MGHRAQRKTTTPRSAVAKPATGRGHRELGATVDEQIEDSFPASDPPSYNAGERVGAPARVSHRQPNKKR